MLFHWRSLLAGRLTLKYSKVVHLTEGFSKSLLSITDEKMHMHSFELEFSFIISRYDAYAIELDGSALTLDISASSCIWPLWSCIQWETSDWGGNVTCTDHRPACGNVRQKHTMLNKDMHTSISFLKSWRSFSPIIVCIIIHCVFPFWTFQDCLSISKSSKLGFPISKIIEFMLLARFF